MTKPFREIAADSKAGVAPQILTDVYGNRPPKAAEFGKGVSDQAGAQQAQDARRSVPPGVFDSKR